MLLEISYSPPASRTFYSVLNELHNCTWFEFGTRSERKCALILLDSYVSHRIVQFKCQRKYVVIVRAVANNKTAVRLIWQDFFGCFTRYGSPIPSILFVIHIKIRSKETKMRIPLNFLLPLSLSQCWRQNPLDLGSFPLVRLLWHSEIQSLSLSYLSLNKSKMNYHSRNYGKSINYRRIPFGGNGGKALVENFTFLSLTAVVGSALES